MVKLTVFTFYPPVGISLLPQHYLSNHIKMGDTPREIRISQFTCPEGAFYVARRYLPLKRLNSPQIYFANKSDKLIYLQRMRRDGRRVFPMT